MLNSIFRMKRRYQSRVNVDRHKYSRQIEDGTFNDEDSSDSSSSEICEILQKNDMSLNITYHEFTAALRSQLTSSPIIFFNEIEDSQTTTSSSEEEIADPIFPGSSVSVANFSKDFLAIKSRFSMSDACADAVLRLMTNVLPVPNTCPTMYKLNILADVSDRFSQVQIDNGSCYILDLQSQLKQIIDDNEDIFTFYVDKFGGISDIINSKSFHYIDSDHIKHIYIILSVDGMSSKFQSKMYHVWPIVASILNLHPRLRRQFKNLLFCMLYYGDQKPNFQKYLSLLVDQLHSISFIYANYTVKVKVITLCADLPAKALCLNISQFNGYYGCPMCLIRGEYNSELHRMLYPFDDSSPLRDQMSHQMHINQTSVDNQCYGVKGSTPLSRVMPVPNLPFDSMHLLYLGVVRSILLHILSRRYIDEKNVDVLLRNIKVPVSFKRKPRSLKYKMKFKATEWQHIILYFFCIFFECEHNIIKILVSAMATFIHLLNKPFVTDTDCENASRLIALFRSSALEMFGQCIQSFSMHALQHLASQVKYFGALWSSSAFTFESSFFHLKRYVTGTRNEGNLIVKRFLQSRAFSTHIHPISTHVNNSVSVLGSTSNICNFKSLDPYGKSFSPSSVFIFRFKVNDLVFHSYAYCKKRSSASYFAFLLNGDFVRIDHCVLEDKEIYCCSTSIDIDCNVIQLIDTEFEYKTLLQDNCPTFVVRFGSKKVVPATDFRGHLIVVSQQDRIFGTPVLTSNSFQHD